VVNYLARLGWSHGDDEVFTREQFVAWFDGGHISRSPSRFDFDKLNWLKQPLLKACDDIRLAALVAPRLAARGVDPAADTVRRSTCRPCAACSRTAPRRSTRSQTWR